jgi:ABC-type branched-subunit amino acid transport system ATPase component
VTELGREPARPANPNDERDGAVLLELDGVEKRFGGLPAVRDVSLRVSAGEILALVGPNGAGKSTLLRTVIGLESPSAGRITFGGLDVTKLPPHRTRHSGIAMVLQTPRTFEAMTVFENAVLGALFGAADGRITEAEAFQRADEALAFVGLGGRADDDVGMLNLHQQRFLELARALAGRPRLLLLDEVMAGLNDTELQASIDIVRTARDTLGVTVIWVEHVMKAVMSLAERVVVLHFGQVLVDGTPDVAMRDPDVVEAYLGAR